MGDPDSHALFRQREAELRPLVEQAIAVVLKSEDGGTPLVDDHLFYGAIGIDPKHLVIWYLFKTDREKEASESSGQMKRMIDLTMTALHNFSYPYHSVGRDRICFASKEEIERAGGFREFFQ